MIRPTQLLRLFSIQWTLARYLMNRSVLKGQARWLRWLSYCNPLSFLKQAKTRGDSIRMTIESLGPIFVKFGQILSTRQDLLPEDIIEGLSQLQDHVPPFPNALAVAKIEQSMGQSLQTIFSDFELEPLASASIAQVHAGKLHDGSEVVVKVLRPNIQRVIQKDVALLYGLARFIQRWWAPAKQFRPVALVAEFERTLWDELDLMREAASASQLRRNFIDSKMMYVPAVYWDYTKSDVMVMERIRGIPIANLNMIRASGTNMKTLAERGVTIFFTQVFRDSFFHADMHPGNLFLDITDPEDPKYMAVDFGIMGTLSPQDQYYLGENILAFFARDYRRIALLHVESGWVDPATRIDHFESAIRTVSEPIFEQPLSHISFGKLLLKLFQTAERFNMLIQPQLMLLQKTLFNIEGLGRTLYPELDLWETAQPFMKQWASKRMGLKRIVGGALQEWNRSAAGLLKTPGLAHEVLRHIHYQQRQWTHQQYMESNELARVSRTTRRGWYLGLGAMLSGAAGAVILAAHYPELLHISTGQWAVAAVGVVMLMIALCIRK